MERSSDGKMDKKHILFFISSLRYGGAEKVVVNLSRFFVKSSSYHISIILLEDVMDFPVSNKIEISSLHKSQQNPLDKVFSLIRDPFRLKDFVKKKNVDIVISFMQRPNAINMLSKMLYHIMSQC